VLELPEAFVPPIVDQAVAECYGEVLAVARAERRAARATDLPIIATAAAAGTVHVTVLAR
jgi:hypothetical protein